MMQFHRNICSLASLRACCKDDNIVGGLDADDCEDVEDAEDCDDADDSDDVEDAHDVDAGVDNVVGVSSDTFFKCILHHNKIAIDDYDRLQMSGLSPPRVLAGVLLLLPPSVDRQVALFSSGPDDYLEGKDGGEKRKVPSYIAPQVQDINNTHV